jgi:hypothetical protein
MALEKKATTVTLVAQVTCSWENQRNDNGFICYPDKAAQRIVANRNSF